MPFWIGILWMEFSGPANQATIRFNWVIQWFGSLPIKIPYILWFNNFESYPFDKPKNPLPKKCHITTCFGLTLHFHSITSAPNVLSASMSTALWPVAIVHPSVALVFQGRNPQNAPGKWTCFFSLFLNLSFSPVEILFIPVPGHQKIHPKGGAVFHPDCFEWVMPLWCHANPPCEHVVQEWKYMTESVMNESRIQKHCRALHCSFDWTNDSFSSALMVALHVITFAPNAPASWKRPKAWAHSLRHSHCTYVTMEAAKHGEISGDPRYEALLTGRDAAAQSDDVCLHAYPAWQHDFWMVFTAVLSTEAWRN